MAQPEGSQPIPDFESLKTYVGGMVMQRRRVESPDEPEHKWEAAMVGGANDTHITLYLIGTSVAIAHTLTTHSFPESSENYYGSTYDFRTPTEGEKETYRGRRISYGGSYDPS